MQGNATSEREVRHLTETYQRREGDRDLQRRYDPLTPAGLWNLLEVQRHLLAAFADAAGSMNRLLASEILEVGCGTGGHLVRLAALGVPPERLHGIDLLPDRTAEARRRHPGLDIHDGNATTLPWEDNRFDLVFQATCLSSVLDPTVRAVIAQQMLRVLRPSGAIVSFDFIWNPTNHDTVGLPQRELHRLFPGCRIESRRCLLAPPLARPLAGHGRLLAALLEVVPWLRLHRIALIRPLALSAYGR